MSSHQKHDDMDETGRRHRRKEQHKKKKKKRRKESSSSSRSSSPGEVMRRIEEERERQKEMRRKEKEMVKALETPEEKRLRRIAKKEAKSRKMKARMGWDNDYLHYTNADNPFGDNNLLETFRWDKKLEKEGLQNVDLETLEKISRQKQEANKNELEKVKKRRQEREAERAARDDEMALLQREKEAAQFEEWENQEDQFHLKQALLRSKIRIQDGRAKPIDLLAKYISAEEEVDAVEMHEPYTYLNGLTINDLEDLIEDITVYKELEHGHNLDYWTDITIIVEDELSKLRKLDCEARAVDRRVGIHHAVATDVAKVFRGKTTEQLVALQQQIESKLENETGGIDVSYWESLLSQLKAQLARARLRDRHQENLRRKLEMLKAEQREVVKEEEEHEREMEKQPPASQPSVSDSRDSSAATSDADESEDIVENILELTLQEYEYGRFSPALLTSDDLDPGTIVTDEVDDVQRLEFARNQVTGKGVRVENVMTVEEKALHQEAKKGMLDDEAVFSVEASLGQHTYLWSDKYRPRKPRYFNRVHTGFEWNKYNQTHYDMDNPPPKIVQGYKFNIFYPDLIDKGHTPEYTLATCEDNLDFAILRFSAGPPYEDIAFKIVSREWEYSYRRGFRCQFHNNIFQLWFHFKRYRYRR